MIGETISHYEVLEKVGGGGMGVVYKARDLRLGRFVAIKVLSDALHQTEEEQVRFIHEAKAASALEHKNICTLHEIDETPAGLTFIVMAFYDGESLADRLRGGRMALDEAVRIGRQVAEGLAAAHARQIVHRDVKPANIMLASDGQAKLVDFGLAKLEGQTRVTRAGSTLGTVAYMAPEQARGEEVDGRADVFSLGAVLYEMLTGQPPFRAGHEVAVLERVLHGEPEPVSEGRADVPDVLERLVAACLEKDPRRRPSAEEVRRRLEALSRGTAHPVAGPGLGRALRRPIVAVPAALAVVALVTLTYRMRQQQADTEWARAEAIPGVMRLLNDGRFADALVLARQAETVLPDDPALAELIETATVTVPVTTDPQGAEVFFRPYLDIEAPWTSVGVTPVQAARMPFGYMRIRAELEGHETLEAGATAGVGGVHVALVPEGTARPRMVRAGPGSYPQLRTEPVAVPAFWVDRFEVSNAEFQAFVDGGGYDDPAPWPAALATAAGAWPAGLERFEDETGRPGPATWRLGRFPDGEAEHPVGGVSWFEAAAYCASVGKRLPTLHHWWVAAGTLTDAWGETVVASNFESDGPAPVGTFQGIGGNGTYDMAGNVAEWVWTQASDGARYVLGGSWLDPGYTYQNLTPADPWRRVPSYGFRCASFEAAPGDPVLAPVPEAKYDFRVVDAVDDSTFAEWRAGYAYDAHPLEARLESERLWGGDIRRQTVSYNAAYGDERIVAYVFLPARGDPPYQAVVYSPGVTAYRLSSSASLPEMGLIDFVPRSGRALVYPVYDGSYERRYAAPARGPAERRQRQIQRVQDLNRTVDYLLERDDIDGQSLAYLGVSAGSEYGALYVALEPRIRAAVWIAGGYDPTHMQHEEPFGVPWNYAPRIDIPVLMINGRGDYAIPVETGQIPLFEDLGTPSEDKRHLILEGGHVPRGSGMVREILDWLDRYLGPVG